MHLRLLSQVAPSPAAPHQLDLQRHNLRAAPRYFSDIRHGHVARITELRNYVKQKSALYFRRGCGSLSSGLELPQREREICDRLRAFREVLKISRAAFAVTIGIGTERLASYESGRAPLRYEVFRLIHQHFRLNPSWLVSGHTAPQVDTLIDDSTFLSHVRRKALFSEVYDEHLKSLLEDKTAAFDRAMADVEQRLQRHIAELHAARSDPKLRAAAAQRLAELNDHIQSILQEVRTADRPRRKMNAIAARQKNRS